MNEKELKEFIISKYGSIANFSREVDIPHTTIHSILKRGFLNANLENIFSICRALKIHPESLDTGYDFSQNVVVSNNAVQVNDNAGTIENIGNITYNNTTVEDSNPSHGNIDDSITLQETNEQVQANMLTLLQEILKVNQENLRVQKEILEAIKKAH